MAVTKAGLTTRVYLPSSPYFVHPFEASSNQSCLHSALSLSSGFLNLPTNFNQNSIGTNHSNNLSKMESLNISESHISASEDIKLDTKSVGTFAASLLNTRMVEKSDCLYNNQKNECHKASCSVESEEKDETRVPVNGESCDTVDESTAEEKPNSSCNSRKISPASSDSMERYADLVYDGEIWRCSSFSMCSSCSSSLSSLPSPPSPASPPLYRPKSQLQNSKSISGEINLSSSLPESEFVTALYEKTKSGQQGVSSKLRVIDGDGFIRRAASVCLNKDKTKVLLVSRKGKSEEWIVPGGGLDEGEDAREASIREAYEEAGVRCEVLDYLGLFETHPEESRSGKKHRTAVFVLQVTKEEEDIPEATTLGRKRRWMDLSEAEDKLRHLRPHESVYFRVMKILQMRGLDSS